MFIIENRKIFYTISGSLVLTSMLLIIVIGLPLGIDFRGGTLIEIEYNSQIPDLVMIENNLNNSGFTNSLLQSTGDNGLIVRTKDLAEGDREKLITALGGDAGNSFTEKRFTTIGPSLGNELAKKASLAIILVVALIILFIAFVFRKVSYPVSSWKYGLVAIVALVHDILIPTGLFIILSKINGAEIDALFVTALLAILGLSVNDTIVVFDRVRENLKLKVSKNFSETVGVSLNQTIARSINTSVTTIIVLLALYLFGPDSTKNFALVLSVGLIAGTYSSIFLASPLLVSLEKLRKK